MRRRRMILTRNNPFDFDGDLKNEWKWSERKKEWIKNKNFFEKLDRVLVKEKGIHLGRKEKEVKTHTEMVNFYFLQEKDGRLF